jgi:hypothetical protein
MITFIYLELLTLNKSINLLVSRFGVTHKLFFATYKSSVFIWRYNFICVSLTKFHFSCQIVTIMCFRLGLKMRRKCIHTQWSTKKLCAKLVLWPNPFQILTIYNMGRLIFFWKLELLDLPKLEEKCKSVAWKNVNKVVNKQIWSFVTF